MERVAFAAVDWGWLALIVLGVVVSLFFFRVHVASAANWVPSPERKLVIYIGWPLRAPAEWRKVKQYDRNRLELEDGTSVRPADVHSHLLVYPNNEVMGGTNVFYPLPKGLKMLEPKRGSKPVLTLDSAQVEFGKSVCSVRNGDFRKDAQGKPVYSTTLENVSPKRIRILRFAAYEPVGKQYAITTVTGDYYSAEQFIAWYAAPPDGWISPGQQVKDENNYGRGEGIWAYFGETEEGQRFIATVALPK